MNRFNQGLIALFMVQIVIAGGLYFGSQPPAIDKAQTLLLSAESSQANRITIVDGDGKQTVLSKGDGKWKLPDYHQLHANNIKVDDILSRLKSTQRGWPVATTESGRERFEVADEGFQKKIILSKGDEDIQTLYIGTSPGFRQVHVRAANENDIFAVKLASHELPVEATDWLDKTLLQPEGEIATLKGPDFSFTKRDDGWQLTEGDGETIREEIDKLVNALTRLTIQGAEEKSIDNADYQLTVGMGKGNLDYRFFKAGDTHYVRREDYPLAFKVSKSEYENIVGKSAINLVKQTTLETQSPLTEIESIGDQENRTTPDKQEKGMPRNNS